jgi:hypothetical protein
VREWSRIHAIKRRPAVKGRSIRQAIKARDERAALREIKGGLAGIRLGKNVIEPAAVLKGATLEPAARGWFLKQLPRRAESPAEATALTPLINHLIQLEEDREAERAVREFLDRRDLQP